MYPEVLCIIEGKVIKVTEYNMYEILHASIKSSKRKKTSIYQRINHVKNEVKEYDYCKENV